LPYKNKACRPVFKGFFYYPLPGLKQPFFGGSACESNTPDAGSLRHNRIWSPGRPPDRIRSPIDTGHIKKQKLLGVPINSVSAAIRPSLL